MRSKLIVLLGSVLFIGLFAGSAMPWTIAAAQETDDEPVTAEDYFYRALAHADHQDYEQAVADYDKSIALDPDDAHTYFNQGLAYINLGDYEQALADFNKVIRCQDTK